MLPERDLIGTLEQAYCHSPRACQHLQIAVLGAGLGLDFIAQLCDILEARGELIEPGTIAVFDAGPLDLLQHLGDSALPRYNLMKLGHGRIGGRTALWGTVGYRPDDDRLREWPYDFVQLDERFLAFEKEMGVPEAIPYSGGGLEEQVTHNLKAKFLGDSTVYKIHRAHLAINATGHRWSALDRLRDLHEIGLRLIPHARCTKLVRQHNKIAAIEGTYFGEPFVCRPDIVVVAMGVHCAVALLNDVLPTNIPLLPADHIRLDIQGWMNDNDKWREDPATLGVCVENLRCRARESKVKYHIEVKAAPKRLWPRHMPSGDNLTTARSDNRILAQVQGIAEMHDRLSTKSILRLDARIHDAISLRDLEFKAEIAGKMSEVASAIGIIIPELRDRPLLTNHHEYGLMRIGRGLTVNLAVEDLENLYILAPTGFVDVDDDANPMLKSRVLNSFAAQAIADRCW